jgi:hypothetical protein
LHVSVNRPERNHIDARSERKSITKNGYICVSKCRFLLTDFVIIAILD